ncbi:uncharacterized protein LOC120353005 [Nilaparvata lugens]|uniref:uncharacterized protein LOC120353005 n=1 Tax=Nilaparvata lugens TaxID=108931 RepID=UPI00193D91BD|nr:uncharacterized protein LOC120353005 [Nilaparvata lugens]
MVRNHQRKPGARKYKDFSDETLSRAIKEISQKTVTLRRAAEKYGISPATLSRKMRGMHLKNVGRPCVLSAEDEKVLTQGLVVASEWGFPLTTFDLRLIIKAHLDKRGVNEPRFINNMPGIEWVRGFLIRHKGLLSQRLCQNIKRARAQVSHELIRGYFEELKDSLAGVSPEAIINYDETNLTDDPGRVKIITRRGCKHPDRILDSSKASISVMFCGTASGILLPPYVCYKAEHLYDSWTIGGPKGTRYNRSKNSWFNGPIFEDWFLTVILPYFKRLADNSPKVLLGDNLSSHISFNIVQECEKNNIRFVLLPPNSTHLCQPLDVAFFRPLKGKWRATLNDWKIKNRGCIPKDRFPALLKKCIDSLNVDDACSKNLISGFRATGIHPIDVEQVLKQLPISNQDQEERGRNWCGTLETFLKESRMTETSSNVKQRKKRIHITPGKSVSSEDFHNSSAKRGKESDESDIDEPCPGPSNSSLEPQHEKDTGMCQISDESDVHDESNVAHDESDYSLDQNDNVAKFNFNDFNDNDFVLVKLIYDANIKKTAKKTFVAQILCSNETTGKLEMKFMRKSSKANSIYIFPAIDDIASVKLENIVQKLVPIFIRRGRHCFSVEADF